MHHLRRPPHLAGSAQTAMSNAHRSLVGVLQCNERTESCLGDCRDAANPALLRRQRLRRVNLVTQLAVRPFLAIGKLEC